MLFRQALTKQHSLTTKKNKDKTLDTKKTSENRLSLHVFQQVP
ncbi:hypothetical protein [Marinomonas colpomeniae]|nr:hypothetical protein [Marinomonas colpomeniae]